jgi:hypothetical protein
MIYVRATGAEEVDGRQSPGGDVAAAGYETRIGLQVSESPSGQDCHKQTKG